MPPEAAIGVVTPGHESARTIARLGPDVPETGAVGDRVAVYSARRDGVCAACLLGGDAEQCLNLQVMGSDYDGAWAEFVVVPIPHSSRFPRACHSTKPRSWPTARART